MEQPQKAKVLVVNKNETGRTPFTLTLTQAGQRLFETDMNNSFWKSENSKKTIRKLCKRFDKEVNEDEFMQLGDQANFIINPFKEQDNHDPLKAMFNPTTEDYFTPKGAFISKRLGDKLLSENIFITMQDTKDLFYFNEKYYEQGRVKLETEVKDALGEKFKRSYLDEVAIYIRASTWKKREDMITPKTTIPLQNGLFNLKTQELEDFNEQYLIFDTLPFEYDKKASCPEINLFLKETLKEDDIPLAKQTIAMTLYRDNTVFQKSIMLLGEGSNGKSVFIELIKSFLGEKNCSAVPLQQLCDVNNRFAASRLYGKLANLCADLSKNGLKETGLWKLAVAGDWLEGEEKFKEPFPFKPYCKMFFSANALPYTPDRSHAFFRRWIIFKFEQLFSTEKGNLDANKTAKITTTEELQGLFNSSIPILKDLLETGKFAESKSVDEIQHEYLISADPATAFVESTLDFDVTQMETKDDLFGAFGDFCEEKNTILGKNAREMLFKRIKESFPKSKNERKRIGGGRVWVVVGVKLKKKDEEDQVVQDGILGSGQPKDQIQVDEGLVQSGLSGHTDH